MMMTTVKDIHNCWQALCLQKQSGKKWGKMLWFLCNVMDVFQLWKTQRNHQNAQLCFLFTFNKNKLKGKQIWHGWTMCVRLHTKTDRIAKHHGMACLVTFFSLVVVCYHWLFNTLKRKLIIIHYVQISMVFVTFSERTTKKCVVTKYNLTNIITRIVVQCTPRIIYSRFGFWQWMS